MGKWIIIPGYFDVAHYCGLFEVSIDELLGRNRKCPKEEREAFFKQTGKLTEGRNLDEAVRVHRKMLEKYSGDVYIQFSLVALLYKQYNTWKSIDLEDEINRLCHRIEQSNKPDMQCGARRIRALLSIEKKDYEKAKELINELPSYLCGREIMMERLIKAMGGGEAFDGADS